MTPYAHQIELARITLQILRQYGIAYLATEERTGKTLAAILVAEAANVTNVLVITKKKPLQGWFDTLREFPHDKTYVVTNYHQAHKITFEPDLVILDEAHNYISSYPKKSAIWTHVEKVTKGKPILYLSATPHAQGFQQLFHQFALSTWSPWAKFKNFYLWFKVYGVPFKVMVEGVLKETYSRTNEKVLKDVAHLFVTKTRLELGFDQEPVDKLHYITLDEQTKERYNTLVQSKILYGATPEPIVCDTASKLRYALHMLEGGTAKVDKNYFVLPNEEKIDYILETWGDSKDLVIMYNYKAELTKLSAVFKKALLLQATSYAEGIDLMEYEHLVIYSQDFSTARHTQRRARQANKNRKVPIIVHFLLVKGGASAKVYQRVSVNKENFVDTVFNRL